MLVCCWYSKEQTVFILDNYNIMSVYSTSVQDRDIMLFTSGYMIQDTDFSQFVIGLLQSRIFTNKLEILKLISIENHK
jgi:hypothetical protein